MFIHRAAAGCVLTEPQAATSLASLASPPAASLIAAALCLLRLLLLKQHAADAQSAVCVSCLEKKPLSCSYVLNHSFEAAAFVCCVQDCVLTILHTLISQERACKFKLCRLTMRLQTSSYMGGIFFP